MEIVADILSVARGGAKKTQIMYQANLSYKLLTSYLKYVIDVGLVGMEDGDIYQLTDKGSDFLQEFKSYFERRVEVEEELSNVQDERKLLVNRFLNAGRMGAGSKNPAGKKGEK